MEFIPSSWLQLFALETPLLELVARASALYVAILFLIRISPRRTGGELAMMDLIFVILIAEAASHSLGDYTSVTDGIILVLTLLGWNYAINALSYHVPFIERLVTAPPLQVIRHGRLLRRNMRREFLTEEELLGILREQGIDDVRDVKAAYVEGEGHIAVIGSERSG